MKKTLGAGTITFALLTFFLHNSINITTRTNTDEKNTPRISTTVGDDGSSSTPTTTDDDHAHHYYHPSPLEQYAFDNAESLGYTADIKGSALKPVCQLWKDPAYTKNKNSTDNTYEQLQQYLAEISNYEEMVDNMNVQPDVREQQQLTQPEIVTPFRVCDKLQVLTETYRHFLSYHSKFGYIEPLLPPLRNPGMCLNHTRGTRLSLRHLVMDYGSICNAVLLLDQRQKEVTRGKPPRTVLIDMGASFVFRAGASPALKLIEQYQKFGIHFDHIYGYELKEVDTKKLFLEQMPEELMQSYHWMNIGVSHELGHKLNPWTMVLRDFTEDDFIVVKMDIDHSPTEMPLADQLRNHTRLHKLVDHFYFEQHVLMKEMLPLWGGTSAGSVYSSMKLFRELREVGVAAHSWV